MPIRRHLTWLAVRWCAAIVATGVVCGTGRSAAQLADLQPRDVVARVTISEVQIAPNGNCIVYATDSADLQANQFRKRFWQVSTTGTAPAALPIHNTAVRLRWRPDGQSVSYLAPDAHDITQIWEYDGESGLHQLTFDSVEVVSYEWASDSRTLAVGLKVDAGPAERAGGVVIDILRFFSPQLFSRQGIDPLNVHFDYRRRTELWSHDLASGERSFVTGSLASDGYAWSPDGTRLAFSAHGELGRIPPPMAAASLFVYDRDSGRVDLIRAGAGGDYLDETTTYRDPFWSPDGRFIGYFRVDWRDRFAASPQIGVVAPASGQTVISIPAERLELYQPRPFWPKPDTIIIESTRRASRGLFALNLATRSASRLNVSSGSSRMHSMATGGRFIAFVGERIDSPADLYIWDRATGERRRLTQLNPDLENLGSPRVNRVRWVAADGVEVEGWLYLPRVGNPPYPTLAFVHGGPAWPYGDEYEPYVRIWPHSPGVYAANGMAVLVPNYRGTPSYGKAFRQPLALDTEPVDDIISGVTMLVDTGIADPDRLGIAGHSHGCWLGALVAVRYRRFAAASCAEGSTDRIASYGRNAGWINTELVDFYWGGGSSPYEAPGVYRQISPVYGLSGLGTAFLFEAGELANALAGAEFAMAAWRSGVPHELVIYPGTRHNVAQPHTMLEVMQRNLEWFEFWLLDRERSSDTKQAQYDRWRKMKNRGAG